jgi:Universal stress protein UspA and related nucleotide-binding proteins
MVASKIMVAYDESDHSKKAVDWALKMQESLGTAIEVVTVLPPMGSPFIYENQPLSLLDLRESQKKCAVEALEELRQKCEAAGRTITPIVLEGSVADSLLKHSEKSGADLIVTGTRGKGGFTGLLMGSIAQKLVTYAKIPVVVIK